MLRWENLGTVSLSQSRVVPYFLARPMIEILAGQAMINANFMAKDPGTPPSSLGTAIRIRRGTKNAIVDSIQLNGNKIENGAGPRALLANNQP